jgi:reductive dehalogenase
LSVPLALAAGLGEAGRHGLLITEKFGPRVRLSKVFTDLPLAHDDYRPFGATEFCSTCRKCARRCPSQAIPHGDPTTKGPTTSNHSGVLKWYVNSEKCYQFWSRNMMDCANCIAVCPFNKRPGRLHDLARFLVRRAPAFNRLMVRLDDLCGYGKPIPTPEKTFWESD